MGSSATEPGGEAPQMSRATISRGGAHSGPASSGHHGVSLRMRVAAPQRHCCEGWAARTSVQKAMKGSRWVRRSESASHISWKVCMNTHACCTLQRRLPTRGCMCGLLRFLTQQASMLFANRQRVRDEPAPECRAEEVAERERKTRWRSVGESLPMSVASGTWDRGWQNCQCGVVGCQQARRRAAWCFPYNGRAWPRTWLRCSLQGQLRLIARSCWLGQGMK